MRVPALAVGVLVLLATPAVAVPEGPEDGTSEWQQREAANFLKTREEHNRQLASPEFQLRLTEQSVQNGLDYEAFQLENAFLNYGNICRQWGENCLGDPFQYPGFDPFWDDVGGFTETLFRDRGCARISGRVWFPLAASAGADLPGVVITNGSVQAPEPLYWWAAMALVEAGYTVMTWDPRGQGRSDTQTPSGEQGSNANPTVFWDGTVDAIDFFHSTPANPYPHNDRCAAEVAADPIDALVYGLANAAPYNPHHDILDRSRLGLAGHSLGATGVSRVQAMDPWEGSLPGVAANPVDVIVGWDSLSSGPEYTPRVPAMGHSSEYGLVNVPFGSSPNSDGHTEAFASWVEAGQPVVQFTIQGSTHYEWSLIPSRPAVNFSSTSWIDWGLPMAEHHTVAWFDRWLKEPGETGYADADARLLDDAQFCDRFSFYFRSARNFDDRNGGEHVNPDIRASCLAGEVDAPAPPPAPAADPGPAPAPAEEPLAATGGGLGLLVGLVLAAGALGVRVRR